MNQRGNKESLLGLLGLLEQGDLGDQGDLEDQGLTLHPDGLRSERPMPILQRKT